MPQRPVRGEYVGAHPESRINWGRRTTRLAHNGAARRHRKRPTHRRHWRCRHCISTWRAAACYNGCGCRLPVCSQTRRYDFHGCVIARDGPTVCEARWRAASRRPSLASGGARAAAAAHSTRATVGLHNGRRRQHARAEHTGHCSGEHVAGHAASAACPGRRHHCRTQHRAARRSRHGCRHGIPGPRPTAHSVRPCRRRQGWSCVACLHAAESNCQAFRARFNAPRRDCIQWCRRLVARPAHSDSRCSAWRNGPAHVVASIKQIVWRHCRRFSCGIRAFAAFASVSNRRRVLVVADAGNARPRCAHRSRPRGWRARLHKESDGTRRNRWLVRFRARDAVFWCNVRIMVGRLPSTRR